MAWTYSDWPSQTTRAARLTRLRLHVAEVANDIGTEKSGHGYSEGSGSVVQYHASLTEQLQRLESTVVETGSGNPVLSRVRIDRR
jgi:hypothetical protein